MKKPAAAERKALGAFLSSRRGRLQPADLGISTGQRRTPGMRREEVALLAGISVSWYAWLEQGRDISVSAATLGRLSRVLRLDPAEADLPFSDDVAAVLRWALDNERHIISICHGPAALLTLSAKGNAGAFPFAGYTITAFPDAADRMIPDIGYMPGHLTWQFGAKLTALGVTIANSEPDESTHKDRKLLTGASPLAANALGKLAAETLLSEVASSGV